MPTSCRAVTSRSPSATRAVTAAGTGCSAALDAERHLASVHSAELDYYTQPRTETTVELVEMWEHYNEAYQLNARVLSMGLLREGEGVAANQVIDALLEAVALP